MRSGTDVRQVMIDQTPRPAVVKLLFISLRTGGCRPLRETPRLEYWRSALT